MSLICLYLLWLLIDLINFYHFLFPKYMFYISFSFFSCFIDFYWISRICFISFPLLLYWNDSFSLLELNNGTITSYLCVTKKKIENRNTNSYLLYILDNIRNKGHLLTMPFVQHNNPVNSILESPFYRQEILDSDSLSDLSKALQPVTSRSGDETCSVWFHSMPFLLPATLLMQRLTPDCCRTVITVFLSSHSHILVTRPCYLCVLVIIQKWKWMNTGLGTSTGQRQPWAEK